MKRSESPAALDLHRVHFEGPAFFIREEREEAVPSLVLGHRFDGVARDDHGVGPRKTMRFDLGVFAGFIVIMRRATGGRSTWRWGSRWSIDSVPRLR
ncbi:MAG TPA: hypothetical protein VNT01_16630 [Symbiobacteriaceae bacterium]|nr:hypothetical protein [Symbiobacteriaceae bacterium]